MTSGRPRRPWNVTVAVFGACFGALCFVVVHMVMADTVDPLSRPVSDYALASPGTTLFSLGILAVTVSCGALAGSGLGLPDEVRLRASLAAVSVVLILVVVFRTDTGDVVTSAAGQIHRYASGVAFLLLTCSGWMVWRRLVTVGDDSAPVLGGLTLLAFAALVLTGLNTLELEFFGRWRGVPQRLLLTVQTVLIVVMASVAGRTARSGGGHRERGRPVSDEIDPSGTRRPDAPVPKCG